MPKRSRLLIDRQVQSSLMLRMLLHWSLMVVCLVIVNSIISLLMMAGERPLTSGVGDAIKEQVPLLVVLVVLLPVFIRDTLKLSNRFAGPMYRIRTALQAINRGEEPIEEQRPVKLRTGDFWMDAADDFNGVLEKMKSLQSENAEYRRKSFETQESAV